MALRSLVVDDSLHTLDIQTTGGQVGGKEESDRSITEVLHTFDTLESRSASRSKAVVVVIAQTYLFLTHATM